jgi:hypothetical protein
MKKQIMIGLFTLMSSYAVNAQYGFASPVGIATVNTSVTPASINLTATSSTYSYLAGAIWNNATVDFTRSFTLEYDAYVDILYNGGADGYCAVFKENTSLTSMGSTAGYLGYYYGADFMNSFAIEFDDFNNNGAIGDPSPYFDHIMIAQNGSYAPSDIIAAPVSILPSGGTIKDFMYHHYTIEWICNSNTLNVYVDGNQRVSTTTFDYRTLFTNPAAVTWGFTGGVGSSGSNHILQNVVLQSGQACDRSCRYNPVVTSATVGAGQTQLTVTPNSANVLIAGYLWDFGDGSATVTTANNTVLHTYATAGGYNVTVTILGYNTTTGECCPFKFSTQIKAEGGHKDPKAAVVMAPGVSTDFQVSPNPTTGNINIQTARFKFTAVRLVNVNGNKAIDITFEATSNKDVDLHALSNGLYLLQLLDETGQLHTQKISVQK